ncbi:hypothetical protein [Sporomusa sp.]|uniref:hypothetical protein n=1 Tax=Sporomusa sp. TaxID=2078658 RepID=UPI002CBB79EF|nr:hypothetical protein [Sporomusa sp.]HWR07578.1 hypothetical protein [Sporomusa sp.]
MGKNFKVDLKGFKEFTQKLKEAVSGDLQKQYNLFGSKRPGWSFLTLCRMKLLG